MVRAVDSAGNVSGWGDCDFTVVAPGKVAFVNCATVDNNLMLYWTAPDTVFSLSASMSSPKSTGTATRWR